MTIRGRVHPCVTTFRGQPIARTVVNVTKLSKSRSIGCLLSRQCLTDSRPAIRRDQTLYCWPPKPEHESALLNHCDVTELGRDRSNANATMWVKLILEWFDGLFSFRVRDLSRIYCCVTKWDIVCFTYCFLFENQKYLKVFKVRQFSMFLMLVSTFLLNQHHPVIIPQTKPPDCHFYFDFYSQILSNSFLQLIGLSIRVEIK